MKRIFFIACIVIAIHVLFIGCGPKIVRHNSLMSHELTNDFLSVISNYEDLTMHNSFLDSVVMDRPELRKAIKPEIDSHSNALRDGYFRIKNEFTISHYYTIVDSIIYVSSLDHHLPAKWNEAGIYLATESHLGTSKDDFINIILSAGAQRVVEEPWGDNKVIEVRFNYNDYSYTTYFETGINLQKLVIGRSGSNRKTLDKNSVKGKLISAEFRVCRKLHTIEGYTEFLDEYPQTKQSSEAFQLMVELMSKEPNKVALYKDFARKYPDDMEYLPGNYSLYLVGPEKFKIYKIAELLKKGVDEDLILLKISRSKEKYKNFEFDQIEVLKEMGFSNKIIATMMDVTIKLQQEEQHLVQQESVLKAEKKHLSKENGTIQQVEQTDEDDIVEQIGKEVLKRKKEEAIRKITDKLPLPFPF